MFRQSSAAVATSRAGH